MGLSDIVARVVMIVSINAFQGGMAPQWVIDEFRNIVLERVGARSIKGLRIALFTRDIDLGDLVGTATERMTVLLLGDAAISSTGDLVDLGGWSQVPGVSARVEHNTHIMVDAIDGPGLGRERMSDFVHIMMSGDEVTSGAMDDLLELESLRCLRSLSNRTVAWQVVVQRLQRIVALARHLEADNRRWTDDAEALAASIAEAVGHYHRDSVAAGCLHAMMECQTDADIEMLAKDVVQAGCEGVVKTFLGSRVPTRGRLPAGDGPYRGQMPVGRVAQEVIACIANAGQTPGLGIFNDRLVGR